MLFRFLVVMSYICCWVGLCCSDVCCNSGVLTCMFYLFSVCYCSWLIFGYGWIVGLVFGVFIV